MGVLEINNVSFKHDLDASSIAAFREQVVAAHAKRREAIVALRSAKAAQSWLGVYKAKHTLLGDKLVKLDALVRANARLPAKARMTVDQCLQASETLNLYKHDYEIVRLSLKKKSNGYRPIQSFGPRKKAAQLMVLQLMEQAYIPKGYQHTMKGVHAAIAAVKAQIKSGADHYVHLDIQNHFGSFGKTELIDELPLPPEVVEHVALAQGNCPAWGAKSAMAHHSPLALPLHTPEAKAALRGLAQGSACAPIIAAFCVARLPWLPPAGVAVANYADNFLLLGSSKNLLAETEEELKAAFAKAPGGLFKLVLKEKGRVADGFTFLGHSLQMKAGQLRAWPWWQALDSLQGQLDRIEVRLGKIAFISGGKAAKVEAGALRLLARYKVLIQGWRSAYRECDDLERFFGMYDASLAEWMTDCQVTIEEVKAAITPDIAEVPQTFGRYS